MTDKQALSILVARGYGIGSPDVHTGYVRVWMRNSEEGVDVRLGRELHELAEDRLTFDDVCERREDEMVVQME